MTMMTGLAAPLSAALAAKGYSALTPVQEAVLAPELSGADLLVSAQTGSGKTVAFGLAIAPDILDGADALPAAGKPLALVIAPTRELALQVRREFEWLFAAAGGVIASCVGGMDWRTERRALERGAQIVVGTPGRLRDHIERGSLDLTSARAAVLDEADEMLDLGFAEDLGFILSALPQPRRVLMFSATVPKGIEALAAEHQRDARRISVAGEGAQHADIAYRAVSVGARDRDAAIFNLLRLHDSARAIVFAKTRANVNHLFARMINRGFQAVALSGELSQSERLHALQSLRDGRSRVCIATDVAARGIDLPGLDLVVHADLPTNAEGLLHRSGRTGRAGAKGTSCLMVVPADHRKASRLLRDAKVEAEWTKPPTAAEVQEAEDARLLDHPALSDDTGEEADLSAALLDRHGALRVAAAFVRLWRTGRAAPEVLTDEAMLPDRPAAPPRPRAEFGPAVWFEIGVGHEGRAEARWLLPKLCDAGGVDKAAIGAIRVQRNATFVQVAEAQAGRFAGMNELEPGLSLRRVEGEPAMERPERDARPARRDDGDRPRQPYAPRGRDDGDAPRKPYTPRPAATEGGDRARKPYAPRPRDDGDAPRKPYTPRPAATEGGDRPRKPYAP
ncbi:MAG TPA: DEAD/DEAH box helicase, partial [Paracoccaceae bacterium]|nr:DEAD/DEAH box helicase [Paracoccaceae bacterium]